jgi:hypothetical protein
MPDYRVAKVNRSRNLVAHQLARLFRVGPMTGVLVGSAPSCVMSPVDRD